MAESMFDKYAGKKIDCTVDGYMGKFDATLVFSSELSSVNAYVEWHSQNNDFRYAFCVSVHVAIGRCEEAEDRGEKPNFYYS